MLYLTRRELLTCLGAAGATGLLQGVRPSFVMADAAPSGVERYLVIVNLLGGIDLLEALPFVQGTSAAAMIGARRSQLAMNIAPSGAMYVNPALGIAMHPAWAPLHSIFQEGKMRFVYGYGNPPRPLTGNSRYDGSHEFNQAVQAFGDMYFSGTSNGVLAKLRERFSLQREQVIALGMQGGAEFAHSDPSQVPYVASDLGSLQHLPLLDQLGGTAESEKILAASRRLREAHLRHNPDDRIVRAIVQGLDRMDGAVDFFSQINSYQGLTGNYSNSGMGVTLRGIAKAIGTLRGSGRGRVFYTTYPAADWDTHGFVNQNTALSTLIGDLAGNLAALCQDLRTTMGSDVWSRTTVIATSEFGRQVAANSAGIGTDHGMGGLAFALGGSVQGGGLSSGLSLGTGISAVNWSTSFAVPVTVHFQNLFGEAFEWMGFSRSELFSQSQYVRMPLGILPTA
jgi:uncharacterized protein (DUF1501 family)